MGLAKLRKMLRERRGRRSLYCTAAYWDAKVAEYDGSSISMWANKTLNIHYQEEQLKFIESLGWRFEDQKVLDLGCGTGRLARWFAARGARVTGLDFSAASIEVARGLSSGPNPAYQVGSLFDLQAEGQYDLIFTWSVLTVACRDGAELDRALAVIRRALKDGGRALFLEPVHKGFLARVLSLDRREFLARMNAGGLDVTRAAPLYFWPVRLLLAYIPWPAWLTTPVYHLGRFLMKWPGLDRLGDYWAFSALKAQTFPLSGTIRGPALPGSVGL